MSLKTDYLNGSTGITDKCIASFDLGVAWVVANISAISTALKANGAAGLREFKMSIATTDNLSNMMGNSGRNDIANAYIAGIQKGFADEDIYDYELSIELTGSASSAYVQLSFIF